MRLDKFLAHAQIGTRKEVKQIIRKKRVCVNGVVCSKDDTHIDETQDIITIDGEEVYYEQYVYIMLNKPQGVISATQDTQHETVLDCIDVLLPKGCFPVGRLDIDTEGLLLITNDGKLSHQLLSPKHHIDKRYYVEVAKSLSKEMIHTLENGSIVLDEKVIQEANVEQINDKSCYLTIKEGRFHQIKRMMHAVGNEVVYLKRVQMGTLVLDETLSCGDWRWLSDEEIQQLKAYTG